ncbi:MAG: hypothetical protein ACLTSX_08180 [Collinsella sp.]
MRDLEAAGFSVKTEALDTDDFVKRYRSAEFDCALRTLEPPVPALEAIADELLTYDRSSAGISVYRDERLDHVLAEARRTIDVATRRALIQDAPIHGGGEPAPHPARAPGIYQDRVRPRCRFCRRRLRKIDLLPLSWCNGVWKNISNFFGKKTCTVGGIQVNILPVANVGVAELADALA